MLSMQGLGDYSRNEGYVKGDVTLTNETVKCNFDRGRMFNVDTMDNLETAGIAFGQLAGEFIRTKVAPEEDAFRFAQYAGKTGISKVAAGAALPSRSPVHRLRMVQPLSRRCVLPSLRWTRTRCPQTSAICTSRRCCSAMCRIWTPPRAARSCRISPRWSRCRRAASTLPLSRSPARPARRQAATPRPKAARTSTS